MEKDHILQEIRRTAQANSGTPLGARRFELETGIRRFDWFGKYWARWGDALQEAGYAPNQLQGPHDERLLLERFAQLALELGRLPTNADLRLKRGNDLTFPDANTFYRLGGKTELVLKVTEFCRGRPELRSVVDMCLDYTPPDTRKTSATSRVKDDNLGFVYLIRSGRFYKIGRTNAAGRRERELAIQLPERTSTIHVIKTDDPVGIEAYWHKRFEAKRRHGEWFELDAVEVNAFKRRKFM